MKLAGLLGQASRNSTNRADATACSCRSDESIAHEFSLLDVNFLARFPIVGIQARFPRLPCGIEPTTTEKPA